ncbi:MAG: acyl-ACP--UDP-N-acetylglucosamine O-acyltransferase [Planctomycetota bacterium]|nr:MAG: acyl-ACP--UDP-N-acetylglucosamine O-acyltransferase [Planctomycetota bacterium]
MATKIAPNAHIDPRAELDDDVEIGPFCFIGPGVKIGRGTKLLNHVTLLRDVELGRDNLIYPYAVLGGDPQDIAYAGSPTRVVVGDRNVIRESVTINRASEKEAGVTRLGCDNYLMAGAHVAHDCLVGNHVIISNATLLGGHVHVGDHVTISGGVAVHHYVTVGEYSYIAGLSLVRQDVPPYLLVEGHPARPRCLNMIGLQRKGFSKVVIDPIAEAFRLIYQERKRLDEAERLLKQHNHFTPEVRALVEFIRRQQSGRHGRERDGRFVRENAA